MPKAGRLYTTDSLSAFYVAIFYSFERCVKLASEQILGILMFVSYHPVYLPELMLDLTPTEERLSSGSKQRFSHYFMLVMAIIYCGLGIFLWTEAASVITISPGKRQLLGGIFVLYGIIRFVRTYRQHFQKRHDDAR